MNRRPTHAWVCALTAPLLALLTAVAAAPPGAADDNDKRPPGAAEGTDLSKLDPKQNPLLTPPLRPVEELRFLLHHFLRKGWKDEAFDRYRTGAVDFLNPLLLTDKQIQKLLTDPRYLSFKVREAWRASLVELGPMKKFLAPKLVQQLEDAGIEHLPAISALNRPGDEHAEELLQELEDELDIPREAKAAGSAERRQCASRCAAVYPRETRLSYAHKYDLNVRETARRARDIANARRSAAAAGPNAQAKKEKEVKRDYERVRKLRNATAAQMIAVDFDGVQKEMGQWSTDVLRSVFALAPGPTCPLPSAQSQRRPAPGGAKSSTPVLAAAAVAAGPCDAGEDKDTADAASTTGMGATLALPAMGNGGIDFSTMELRYLADPGDGSGLQYSFSADLNPLKGDIRRSTGIAAATRSSDAFFVWLSLDPSDFWVNLDPTEPDRIVDDQLGRTDAGRILLEADLRMKKTVGKLIHPHTALGRQYWDSLQGECMSYRNWITPAPASVHQDGDKLYILDAPLDVKMETEYLSELGGSNATPTCPQQDQATEEHNEELFRSLILPRLKDAINTAPEYADLRRVYLARVAAEWYRERNRTKDTTYGELIDTGDITDWRTTDDWTPRDTFDKYVDSYTEGEFDVTDKTADGAKNYVYGGVDLTRVSLQQVPDDRFDADFGTLPEGVDRSLRTPSAVGADDDTVWLGAPTPRQAAGLGPPGKPVSAGTWALRLLPLPIVVLVLLLWRRRRRLNATQSASPLRRAAVGGRRQRS
ncbi:hypothetical protein [Streptomyces sp. NPDC060065]|uniref:hypothetical protein n=1 Tax=Streptomyces sp. NPDC060065 TaxID=3347050 RepID=UPI0036A2740F